MFGQVKNDPPVDAPDYAAPVTLESATIRLEPLALAHVADLRAVGLDPELWRWTTSHVTTEADLRRYIEKALDEAARRQSVPFAVVLRDSGRAVGSTRLGNLAPAHRRVEIGWTWIGRAWQRTRVNTEAKRLLLGHAFETLGCIRVELKTDVRNEPSQRAMERIGATREGVLRHHVITETGRVRDTVYYSILADEWPAVKARLDERLARG